MTCPRSIMMTCGADDRPATSCSARPSRSSLGDALQTQAYEVLAELRCPAEARVRVIGVIAHGTGTIDGMIGGQVVDLESEHSDPDLHISNTSTVQKPRR